MSIIKHSIIIVLIFINLKCLVVNGNTDKDDVVVKIDSGLIRGYKDKTIFDNNSYYAFKGIPYATAPVRYKSPQKPESWNDEILDAKHFGNDCVQAVVLFKFFNSLSTVGDEDCLFLNIYTPNTSPDADLSTIVFIHGGGFCEGSGSVYGPDFLIDENVILVTFNYRLGPFGFMSLGTSEYSGNMAMKDQLLALQWVNRNIHAFGGNKNRITLAGHSAGSASAHYHMISPVSAGLFQRAIVMSGSALNSWANGEQYSEQEHFQRTAKHFNKLNSNVKDLMKFLNEIDAHELAEISKISFFNVGLSEKAADQILWSPLTEPENSPLRFLPDTPENIVNNANFKSDVDVMFGITSSESMFLISDEIHNPNLLKPFDEHFQVKLPIKNFTLSYDTQEYRKLAQSIRTTYFGREGKVNEQTLKQYMDLMSDFWFQYYLEKSVKIQFEKSTKNTYMYLFDIDGELNLFKKQFDMESMVGSSHGDELCYVFRCMFDSKLYDNYIGDTFERKTIKTIGQLWGNFIKYGKQTAKIDGNTYEFDPISNSKELNYMVIGNNGLYKEVNHRKKYMHFMDQVITKFTSSKRHDNRPRVRTEL